MKLHLFQNHLRQTLFTLFLLLMGSLLLTTGSESKFQGEPVLGFHIARGDVAHIEAAKAAGAGFAVIVFNWDTIEPDPNNVYWEVPDAALRAAEFYGLEVVARLDRPPQWAFDGTNPSPWQLLAYEAFVRRVASRYGDRLAGIIVWNEPNLSLEWDGRPPIPEGYVQMLRPAYRAVKLVAPDLPVLAAGLAMTTSDDNTAMSDLEFLQGIYDAGGGEFFDILAAHPYGFGRSPSEAPNPDRLNFRRLELQREIMAANGDADKPIWITEMGWRTSAPDPNDTWQVVTPQQQSNYIFQAIDYAAENYPWLEKMALWELNNQGDDYGYYLWHGAEEISQAYQDLVDACTATGGNCQRDPTKQSTDAADPISILEPDVAIRLGDRGTLHPHWVHLHRGGENFSPDWQGDFFLSEAQANQSYDLYLETMQVDQPTNHILINGTELAYLQTRTRPDFTSTWVTQQFALDKSLLEPGRNQIKIIIGPRNPARQYSFWRWENFQFRNIRLVAPQPEPQPLLTNWQARPSPSGWSETNRLRPGLQNDFWLTGNRPGELWQGHKTETNAAASLTNQAANRLDLVFIDILPTPAGELTITNQGLFWQAANHTNWEVITDGPQAHGYIVTRHENQFYAGFEAMGLWTASQPTGPWRSAGLADLTVLDIAFGSTGQTYAATSNGVYAKIDQGSDWQRLPSLPGDSQGQNGNPLKRFITRIYVGQNDEIVVRNLDQLWRYPADNLEGIPPIEWQSFGPSSLHEANKIYTFLNCCDTGAIVGTNFSGLWQLSNENSWERFDNGLFDATDATELLRLDGDLYAAGNVALMQSFDGGQRWNKVEGLPPTLSNLLIDPGNPTRWLAGTAAGVYRSEDGGQSWQAISPPWTVWDMDFGVDGRLFVARTQGVAWADDLSSPAIAWQETSSLSDVLFFNVDPHPTNSRVLLAGSWGNDLGVSYDGGETMRSVNNGLEALSVLDVLWHPNEGQLTVGTIEGLFRTDTFGEAWFKLPGALKQQTVYSLYQTEDSAIWAGAANGLWVSRDYGVTWQRIDAIPPVTIMRLGTVTLNDQAWLWAGTELHGLWLSQDQGTSWQFGGLTERTVYNLQIDPLQPKRVIATTAQGIFDVVTDESTFARRLEIGD